MKRMMLVMLTAAAVACGPQDTHVAEVKSMDEAAMVADPGMLFLEENKSKKGVVVLPSGLQYKVLKSGPEGPKATIRDQVTTHYHGTFIDGSVFDSSVERGEPITFPVSGVIAGWTEALQLMDVGDKWELVVPYHLAYGPRGGRGIPPKSTLIFEVELLDIPSLP